MPMPLGRGQVASIPAVRDPRQIVVRRGVVWVTRDGDPRDHVLGEGQSLPLCPRRAALLQALRSAVVETIDTGFERRQAWWEPRKRCA